MKKGRSIDMCNGSLADKILLFALPLMASSLLQLLFNAGIQLAGLYLHQLGGMEEKLSIPVNVGQGQLAHGSLDPPHAGGHGGL